jgi:GxxExxY protein
MDQLKAVASSVFKSLGPGFEKSVYASAMKVLLEQTSVPCLLQHTLPIMFEGCKIGDIQSADLIVNLDYAVKIVFGHAPGDMTDQNVLECQKVMRVMKISAGLVVYLPYKADEFPTFQDVSFTYVCRRCGRKNHLSADCKAMRHVNGRMILGTV